MPESFKLNPFPAEQATNRAREAREASEKREEAYEEKRAAV